MRRVAPEREGCVTETNSAVDGLVAERFAALREAVGRVVIGQQDALRQIFITLLVGGHSLVEGVPGVAKTLLVRTLASALEL